jgi:hypothetical protein
VKPHPTIRIGIEVTQENYHAVLGELVVGETQRVVNGVDELLLCGPRWDVNIAAEEWSKRGGELDPEYVREMKRERHDGKRICPVIMYDPDEASLPSWKKRLGEGVTWKSLRRLVGDEAGFLDSHGVDASVEKVVVD